MSKKAIMALMASGVFFILLLVGSLAWIFSDSTPTEPERSPDPQQKSPMDEVALQPGEATDDWPDDESDAESPPGDTAEGSSSPERERAESSPPPPSPPPPVVNPNPSGEGEGEGEYVPTGPVYNLRQELERVHRDVGATARLPLSLFR